MSMLSSQTLVFHVSHQSRLDCKSLLPGQIMCAYSIFLDLPLFLNTRLGPGFFFQFPTPATTDIPPLIVLSFYNLGLAVPKYCK
jgi:hypothetical protein